MKPEFSLHQWKIFMKIDHLIQNITDRGMKLLTVLVAYSERISMLVETILPTSAEPKNFVWFHELIPYPVQSTILKIGGEEFALTFRPRDYYCPAGTCTV
jgi:hypothetical protein